MIVNETLDVIKRRRSVRSYTGEQITEEELQAVLEAGLCAPHAADQAWHFTVVQNRELLDRLDLAAREAARQMGVPHLSELADDPAFHTLHRAPTLIIVSGEEQSPVPLEADCAAATENMLIAAESLGLGSCWIFYVMMAFMSPQGPELREALRIPAGYKPYDAAVFGYKKGAVAGAPERKPNLITYL
jgi:nitroreductase